MRFMKWSLQALILLALVGCARAEQPLPTRVLIPEADAASATEEADVDSATAETSAEGVETAEANVILDVGASDENSPAEETDATPEQGERGGAARGGGDLSTPVLITPIAATPAGATPFVITVTPIVVTQQSGTLNVPENATLLDVEDIASLLDTSGRILLNVTGTLVNDCRVPIENVQAVVGTTVYVRIYQVIPENARCSRNILRYNETFPLTVPLTRGEIYTVDVNNTRVQLTAQ